MDTRYSMICPYALAHFIVSQAISVAELREVGFEKPPELYELKISVLDLVNKVPSYRYVSELIIELNNAINRDLVTASTYVGKEHLIHVLSKAFTALNSDDPSYVKEAIMDVATVLDIDFEKSPTLTKVVLEDNLEILKSTLLILLILSVKIE